jgi:hypothetical protein
LVESAPDHARLRDAIDQARTRYVPGLVLAEVDYFLRDERSAMREFMQDLARRQRATCVTSRLFDFATDARSS